MHCCGDNVLPRRGIITNYERTRRRKWERIIPTQPCSQSVKRDDEARIWSRLQVGSRVADWSGPPTKPPYCEIPFHWWNHTHARQSCNGMTGGNSLHWRIPKLENGGRGERGSKPITGVWGLSLSGVQGQPLVRRSGGRVPSPRKLKAFWQSRIEFPLKYFVFLCVFLSCSHCPLYMTGRGGTWPDWPLDPPVQVHTPFWQFHSRL